MPLTRAEILGQIGVVAKDATECQLLYRGWTIHASLYDESKGARWKNVNFLATDQRLKGEKERAGALPPLTQCERDTLKEHAVKAMLPLWERRREKHLSVNQPVQEF